MQLSARILTALAVLAFAVAIIAGNQNANTNVSAATGTIDALNVGTCTTTNADVFEIGDCTQRNAFYQGDELEDLIEVEDLYATYAHDPKTAAEAPRAIIKDGDLIRISITDKGRDRRDPVLITSANTGFDNTGGNPFDELPATPGIDPDQMLRTIPAVDYDGNGTVEADEGEVEINAKNIVADSIHGDDGEDDIVKLPGLEQAVQFGLNGEDTSTFATSGSYEIVFTDSTDDEKYKPVAPDGKVVFFGRVSDDGTNFGKFMEIGQFVKLDEDVVSGETDPGNTPPAMSLNISVPRGGSIQLQLIYYETSGIDYIQGGDDCFTGARSADRTERYIAQAMCTSKEMERDANGNGAPFVVYAESDEDAGDSRRNLALVETGLFTGVFQGELRLTDADGNGGENDARNWGLMRKDATSTPDEGNKFAIDEDDLTEAVIGVNAGPVIIRYKDTDGQTRPYNIDIDVDPPTIQIDSPQNGSRSDDDKPSFIGSFNDSDSGLAAGSFQLNVDNKDERPDSTSIINIPTDNVEGPDGEFSQVRRRLDYKVKEESEDPFGVIGTADGEAGRVQIYRAEDTPPDGQAEDWKSVESDDFANGALDGEFNDEVEIDFDEFDDVVDDQSGGAFTGFNNAIDFQAAVRDLAGNIGFSDSDAANPRFINDLGADDADGNDENANRAKGPGKHNVLGVFSRHIVWIDELDPYIMEDMSATGFYGTNSDDKLVRDRSAVMIVFDNDVEGSLIDTSTFTVQHDKDSPIAITDVLVEDNRVFLKLGEELASDAEPMLSITDGREIEDKAGNLLRSEENLYGPQSDETVKSIEVADGILPVLTLKLSGGSGTGVGGEGPAKLTNGAIDVEIESDEDINGSPFVSVVCTNIGWSKNDLDDYIANRTGFESGPTPEGDDADLMCGDDDEPSEFRNTRSLSRPGNVWIYAWRNAEDNANAVTRRLNDGELVVVAWARDRSQYDGAECDGKCENWGSVTARFTLDDTFNSPLNNDGSGGSVQPGNGDEVTEPRPFVTLDFAGERTTVSVSKFMVDGEDALSSLENIGENRFLYWPEALDFGEHKIEFDARDAADNEPSGKTSFTFNVMARDPFVLDITAGWNAISFPANPVNSAVDAVFTEEAVDRVVGWNPTSSTGPWSMASRIDGVWTTNMDFAPLTDIETRYGYWVHSSAFVKQNVDLEGPIDRETGNNPHPIAVITVPGWNFVGVVDQDGDQTEGDAGEALKGLDDGKPTDAITAKDYMPGFRQAYTWDAIAHGYRVLKEGDSVLTGQGIWVFFPQQDTIAP